MLYLFAMQQVYAHGPNCKMHHDVNTIEYVKDVVANSCKHALEWYNGHAIVANAVALLGVSYMLYRNYCPVANRCKECLEDSKK